MSRFVVDDTRVRAKLRALLPRGRTLPDDLWLARHRTLVVVLWAHAVGIPVFALARGFGLVHAAIDSLPVVMLAATATVTRFGVSRRGRSMVAAVGLLMCSAILVHLSGGMIEMHFHFFVMVGLITLYQDWLPFLAAIAFVALHHGVIGVLAPEGVYSHADAWAAPWKWAGIHALFVLAASAAQLTSWRVVEEQHERSEEVLRARERRFRALIENSSDVVSVIGVDGVVTYDSPSVARVLGYEPSARMGRPAREFVHPDDLHRVEEAFGHDGVVSKAWVEVRVRHADGSWRWAEVHVTDARSQPDIRGVVVNLRDTTERKALEDRLAHQAFHDPLTGLANRALFHDRVEHALASNKRQPDLSLAVLYLDLDDFKTINDALGHSAGDEVLVEIAARLARCVRPGDTCARLGGDEFAILLEGMRNASEAYEVGVRLLDTVRDPIVVEGNTLSLNASIGVVVDGGGTDSDIEDAVALVRNADLAMYKAKGGGKGRFEIFERGMHEAVLERLELKADLRRAVDGHEFVPHYQPVVDLVTGESVGAEALMRWDHPTKGLLAPAAFMDLAEETGLIVCMGRDLLRQACRDAAAWPDGPGGPRSVSVNLSVRQLQDPAIVDDVRDALAMSGLAPSRLTLEITESLLIADPEAAADALVALKGLGVMLSLDDFGTGYSSLSYLGRFPVDALKIDRSFVSALQAGGVDSELVSAIVGLGRTLDMRVTAEGIEEASQVRGLLGLGCRLGQGYHFARPMPIAELTARWGGVPVVDGVPAVDGVVAGGVVADSVVDGVSATTPAVVAVAG
jgi:diguanylate cyclase (GGDEF)-like protein/PAS domain S-box-containing protein